MSFICEICGKEKENKEIANQTKGLFFGDCFYECRECVEEREKEMEAIKKEFKNYYHDEKKGD